MNVINERWSDLSLHFLVLLDAMSEWDTPTPPQCYRWAHLYGAGSSNELTVFSE